MNDIAKYKSLALGLLLAGFGFLGGYLTGEHGDPQRQAYAAEPVSRLEASTQHKLPPHRALRHREGRTIEMYWNSQMPQTTVVIVENGNLEDPVMTNSAPPKTKQHATMLALLLLTGMPALTWAALAWNRRRMANRDLQETTYHQEFVPRRDD